MKVKFLQLKMETKNTFLKNTLSKNTFQVTRCNMRQSFIIIIIFYNSMAFHVSERHK